MKGRRGTRLIKTHGGSRVGAGAPAGNLNGQKSVKMPDCDLSTRRGVQKFVRDFLIPAAVSGKLGVRTITALTTCSKVLLDAQEADVLEELEKRIKVLEESRGVKVN